MKKLVFNIASVAKFKILCLFALVVLTGVNGEVWGQQNTSFVSQSNGDGVWTTKDNWANNGGHFPGEVIYHNTYGDYGSGLVTISNVIEMNDMSAYIGNRSSAPHFDIQKLTLNSGANLTLNYSLFLSGSGNTSNQSFVYNGGSITVNDGTEFTVNKAIVLKSDLTINGDGKVVINRIMNADGGGDDGRTLTANVNLKITTQNDVFENTDFSTVGNFSLDIKKRADFIRQSKNSTTAFKSITIDGADASFHINANGKTVSSQTLTISGGTLEIASGSTYSITSSPKVMTVTGESVLKGTGTLNVERIDIGEGSVLSVEDTRTFNGIVFPGNGTLKVASGTTLTLNNTSSVGGLIVEEGATLKINSPLTVTGDATLGGTINAGSNTITINGSHVTFSGTPAITGSVVINNNNTTISGLTAAVPNVSIPNGKSITYDETSTYIFGVEYNNLESDYEGETTLGGAASVSGNATLLGTITGGNTLTLNSANVTFGELSPVASGSTIAINGKTGSVNINGLKECPNGTVNIASNLNVTYDANSTKIFASTNYGNLTVNNTGNVELCGNVTATVKAEFAGNLIVADGQTLTMPNSDDNSINELTLQSGSTLVANGDLTIGGDATLAGTISGGHQVTLNGNNLSFGDLSISGVGSSVVINNDATITGLTDCIDGLSVATGKNITYNSSSNILSGIYSNLTINGNAELCGNVTVNGDAIVNGEISSVEEQNYKITATGGDVTFGANAAFAANCGMDITGNATINGYTGQIRVTVDDDLDITYGESSTKIYGATYQNLIVNGTGEAELAGNAVVTNALATTKMIDAASNTLTLSNSEIEFSNIVGLSGNVIISSDATLNGVSGCTKYSGATFTFPANVTYGATSVNILAGDYSNLTINASSDVTLCGNVTVGTNLTWNANRIFVDGHNLTVNTITSSGVGGGFGSNHLVVVGGDGADLGSLTITNLSALAFPVGTMHGGSYQYVPVVMSGITTDGDNSSVSVGTDNSLPSGGNDFDMKRIWTFSSNNVSTTSATIVLNYLDIDDPTELIKDVFYNGEKCNEATFDINTGSNTVTLINPESIDGVWTVRNTGAILYSRIDDGSSSVWNDTETWTSNENGIGGTGSVPSGDDLVFMLAGKEISASGTVSAKSLHLGEDAVLNIAEGTTVNFNHLTGVGTLKQVGQFNIGASGKCSQFVSNEGGAIELTVSGAMGNLAAYGTNQFNKLDIITNAATTITQTSDLTVLGALNLTQNGNNVTIGGNVNKSFASITTDGNLTINGSGTITVAAGATLSGNITFANLTLAGDVTIADGSKIIVNGALNAAADDITISGSGTLELKGALPETTIALEGVTVDLAGTNANDIPSYFAVNNGATLKVNRTKPMSNLAINNGSVLVNRAITITGLEMTGSTANFEVDGKDVIVKADATTKTIKLSGVVNASNSGTIKLNGNTIYFDDDIDQLIGNIDLSYGTNIDNLKSCLGNNYTFNEGGKSVTYLESSTHILKGTYGNLEVSNGEITLCGDVTVNGDFKPTGIDDFNIEGSSDSLKIAGSILNSKNLTFNNVVVEVGTKGSSNQLNAALFESNSSLIINGIVTFQTASITLKGEGDIVINKDAILTAATSPQKRTITFGNNKTIKGEGTLEVTTNIIGNKELAISSNVIINTEVSVGATKFIVSGGTFTNNCAGSIEQMALSDSAVFVTTVGATVKSMSMTDSAKVEIGKDITLTVPNGISIADSVSIKGAGTSKIISSTGAANISFAEGTKLTVYGQVGLDKPLLVNNNVTIIGGTADKNDALVWSGSSEVRIATGKKLTIAGKKLEFGGDLTLDGNIVVDSLASLAFRGSEYTFTSASDFVGTHKNGTIEFLESATIKNLKVNTHAKASNFVYADGTTMSYDKSCTIMLPGAYDGLTLHEDNTNIAISDSVEVKGTLTWPAGRIALNGNTMIVNKNDFAVDDEFDETKMFVAGGTSTLVYRFTAGGTKKVALPLGAFSTGSMGEPQYHYTPITIEGATLMEAGWIAVQVESTALLGKGSDLRRYWTITSSESATATSLTLKYTDADDPLGYGASGKGNWTVFKGGSVLDITGVTGTVADNTISVSGTTFGICDTWTASEWPLVGTLYSHKSGDWTNPAIWTTNSAGSTWENPGNVCPNDGNYDVVILENRVVTAGTDGAEVKARSVLLKAPSATLEIKSGENVDITNLSGVGILRIINSGVFPSGISDPSLFMAAGGGTTEFKGNPTGIKEFTLDQNEFNNLVIDYESNDVKIQLPTTAKHKLTINGDLTIEEGILEYTNANQCISVGGNITIDEEGTIINSSGLGSISVADTLIVYGNFKNKGTVQLTKREYGTYDYSQAISYDNDKKIYGRGVLRFMGNNNPEVRFDCLGKTNISQLIIDKGADMGDCRVVLYADVEEHFGLLGCSKNTQAPLGFGKDDGDYPQNPKEIFKPLWIKCGTLELTGNVHIKSLAENGAKPTDRDMFYIPASGCLHLNGNVIVETSIKPTTTAVAYGSLVPAGKLIIDAGRFDCKGSSGVTFVGSTSIVVNGGELRGAQFRPSQDNITGNATFIQTGGTVTFDGRGDVVFKHPLFFMPKAEYTFKMTGGTLEVGSASPGNGSSLGGTFAVKANPENGKITGGKIIINTGKADKNGTDVSAANYLIASELPFHKLELKNEGKYGLAAGKYVKHYIANYTSDGANIVASTEIADTLLIDEGVVFDTDGKTITVGKLVVKSGGTILTKGTNEFVMNGDDGLITMENDAIIAKNTKDDTGDDLGFNNLTIAEESSITVNNDLTVRGTFTLANNAELHDGKDGNVYTMSGDVVVDGTHVKKPTGAGKIVLKGNKICSSGSGVLNNVEINTTNEEFELLDPSDDNRATKLTINGTLDFASNTLFDIHSSNLELGSAANVIATGGKLGENNRMIYTVGSSSRGVTKVYSAGVRKFTFPFGIHLDDNYYYTPATIEYVAADSYGKVTSRPVTGFAFRDASKKSLKCYWITEAQGFENVSNIKLNYYWFSDDLFKEGIKTGYKAAYRNGGDWVFEGTVNVNGTDDNEDERSITMTRTEANGYYTCGQADAFVAGQSLFTSSFVNGNNNADWEDWHCWTTGGVGADPDEVNRPLPNSTTSVQIGDETHHHTIIIKKDNVGQAASLSIAPGSTLDLQGFNGHNFPIVEVDEAVTAGTLKLSSKYFPKGDFGKFLGEHGGTVEYYGGGYVIPNASESGFALTNYCNLVLSGSSEGSLVTMPNTNITVYKDLTVKGWAKSNTSGSATINGNWQINEGKFTMTKVSSAQTYKVLGDVTIGGNATLESGSGGSIANKLVIYGDLTIDGTFNARANSSTFATEFVGQDSSCIDGTTINSIVFDKLSCNKDNLNDRLILKKNIEPLKDKAESTETLIDITKGTLVVDIKTGNLNLTEDKDYTIPQFGCLSVKSGTVSLARRNYTDLHLKGHISVSGSGTLNVGMNANKHNDIKYAPDGRPSVTITNYGKMNVNGQIWRENKKDGSLIWNQSGGDVVVRGKCRNSEQNVCAVFEILESGEFNMSGGTLTIENGEGLDTYGDIYIKPAVANCTGGTIIIGGEGTSQKLQTTIPLHNIEITNSNTLNVYNNISVNDLIIDASGVYNARNQELTIRHGLYNHNNVNEDPIDRISFGFVPGSIDQHTQFVGDDMVIEGVANYSTQFGQLTINGNLSLVSGKSPIRVAGNLTQTIGTVTDNGNNIMLFGDLYFNGDFVGEGGIEMFNINYKQTIHGNSFGTLGTLIVSNNNEVWLDTDLRITKKLQLGGSLYISRSRLILDPTANIVPKKDGKFDSNIMIRVNGQQEDKGVVKYVKKSNSAFDFTIPLGVKDGEKRYYTPAKYYFASNSCDNAVITVKTVNYRHQNISIDPTRWINYFWVVKTEGFDEESVALGEDNGKFNVKQVYRFDKDLIDGAALVEEGVETMLPEYMHYNATDFQWYDVRIKAPASEVKDDSITIYQFGHIAGDYTAGVVDDYIYTALPVLYSKTDGPWESSSTWEYYEDNDISTSPKPYLGTVKGNPVHIRCGHTITLNSVTKAYSLTFETPTSYDLEGKPILGKLNLQDKTGSDFGHVTGAGHLIMEPDAASENKPYMMPAGDFEDFLKATESIIEFTGGDGSLPNSIVGHVSMPLQNVILSGSGTKSLTKEDGEYINGDMTIRSGTKLNFNNTPIHIKGNWIDENSAQAGFVPGSSDAKSLVEFNGTTAQEIQISNNLTSFYNLQINNPNGVTVVKGENATSDIELTVNKKLILGNGLITDTDDACLLLGSSAIVESASSSSFVNGPLKKQISGNESFTFPVGGDGEYAPTTIGNTSTAAKWTVKYHNEGKDGITPEISEFDEVSVNEYWSISASVAANAILSLRLGSGTMTGMNDGLVSRVRIAKDIDSKWRRINSSYKSGKIPNAIIATASALAFGTAATDYTLGYVGTNAWIDTGNEAICDGSTEKANVTVHFSGLGGPYTLTYRVTSVNDGKTKDVTVSNLKDGDMLTFTGNELGAFFGKSEGYTDDYTITAIAVKEGGTSGKIKDESNAVAITVIYNGSFEITGAKYVGMDDKRGYSVPEIPSPYDAADNPYTWTATANVDGLNPDIYSATDREASLQFKDNGSSIYNVTLKATREYKIADVAKTCTKFVEKVIEVRENPQPRIVGGFFACTGIGANFKTENVDGHRYDWGVYENEPDEYSVKYEDGISIENENENECTITWDAKHTGKSLWIQVVETKDIKENGEVVSSISGNATREISLIEGFAFTEDDIEDIDACDNDYGEVVIKNTNGDLMYHLYEADGTTQVSERRGNGANISIRTNTSLKHADIEYDYVVKVENEGCSVTIDDLSMNIREKPAVNPIVDDNDLYIGNLAKVSIEQTSSNAVGAIPNTYSFVYNKDGDDVSYTVGKVIPEDLGDDYSSTIVVPVPFADKLKGVLTISSAEIKNKICSSTYAIDETVSSDYLWKGESSDWNLDNNWWAGEKPDDKTNVIIRSGDKVKTSGGVTVFDESGTFEFPEVALSESNEAKVKDLKLETGASVTVNDGKRLTVYGNVESAGEFKGSGTVEFSNGDHTVQGSSVTFANLTNNGEVTANNPISVTGTLNNAGSFAGDGAVEIDGGAGQILEGDGSFKNIVIENAVTIKGTPIINGEMTLNSGIATAEEQINFTTLGSMNEAGAGWVMGKVMKTWADNEDVFHFMVGGENRPAQLDVKPKATGAIFTVDYSCRESINEPITEGLEGSLARVSGKESWDIKGNRLSEITFHWADAAASGIGVKDNPNDDTWKSSLVVAHRKNAGDNWQIVPGEVHVTDNSIQVTVSDYSEFTFGAKSPDPTINPLPVTFVAFTGRQEGNTIVLDWATASENDNNYFEIERSADGVNYVTIGYVDGAGNSSSLLGYQFTDNAPEQGQLYYRLSQVDFDGNREYADKVVAVLYTGSEIENLTIVPNPTDGLFKVSASGSMAGGRIQLLSQAGQVVRIVDVDSFDATIDISDMPSGIYILRFVTDTKVLQQKVVKY